MRATKVDDDAPYAVAHRDAVKRAGNVMRAREDVNRSTLPFGSRPEGPRASSGIGQLLSGSYPETDSAQEPKNKADVEPLLPAVRAIARDLTEDAARLLNLVAKADLAHRGASLIDVSISDAARALGINDADAEAARNILERRGLLVFYDNGSGDRGFRPRLLENANGLFGR